jgi:hypothetical protein
MRALQVAEKLIGATKIGSLVTGHDRGTHAVRGSPGRDRLIRKDGALQVAEKLIEATKIGSFVTGHDFSRAEIAAKSTLGFSPCKIFFRTTFKSKPVHPIQQ